MKNRIRLLVMFIVCQLISNALFAADSIILTLIAIPIVLYGSLNLLIFILLVCGVIRDTNAPRLRCCPVCQSRHYVVKMRGSKYIFAFPMKFVKVNISDFRCQECQTTWTIHEHEKYE